MNKKYKKNMKVGLRENKRLDCDHGSWRHLSSEYGVVCFRSFANLLSAGSQEK